MRINYGGGSKSVVALTRSGETRAVPSPARSSNTIVQYGRGCDVVFFAEHDQTAGETRLAAVVVTRRSKRPTGEERRILRNRPRVIAAMTAYHVMRFIPSFLRPMIESRAVDVHYDSFERVLRVDDREYGPLDESKTLVILFDTLSKPTTQSTMELPAPPIMSAPVLSDPASIEEWRAGNRERQMQSMRDVSAWAREYVQGVPTVAEFVRESNALAG